MDHDIVIPMLASSWCTRAVIEGLFAHYQPRRIHVISPAKAATDFQRRIDEERWQIGDLKSYEEEVFFESLGLSKQELCSAVDVQHSLYAPGWFYQQLLKLGAHDGIDGISAAYLVWDADLLPLDTWPVLDPQGRPIYALLQHKSKGNPRIVGRWERWIRDVLDADPLIDQVGTFVPHHMWFDRAPLQAMMRRVAAYYQSSEPWPMLMMRSGSEFGTFSEYWLYASWVAKHSGSPPAYYPYDAYGSTTERFFDDGSGPFSTALRQHATLQHPASPSYAEVRNFVEATYIDAPLPSSIAFEQNSRHIKKDPANMHLEEVRSRWHADTLET